jgi:hypothetical protein
MKRYRVYLRTADGRRRSGCLFDTDSWREMAEYVWDSILLAESWWEVEDEQVGRVVGYGYHGPKVWG